MQPPLIQHIERFIPVEQSLCQALLTAFTQIEVRKKEYLLEEGQLCRYHYFVEKGCLRMFFPDDNGNEQTIQFALENWWMTDLDAFKQRKTSAFCIQAIEDSTLMAIDKPSLDKLYQGHPAIERYFRQIYERAYSAALFRMKYLRLPKEEFYHQFLSAYPEFIQRIPQKILASFLDFTPEYLSNLRKKILSKKQ